MNVNFKSIPRRIKNLQIVHTIYRYSRTFHTKKEDLTKSKTHKEPSEYPVWQVLSYSKLFSSGLLTTVEIVVIVMQL